MRLVVIHVAFVQFCQRIVFITATAHHNHHQTHNLISTNKPHRAYQLFEEMMLPYLLTFCRLVIGLTFALSFVGKVRDVGQFAATIDRFKLLPRRWHKTAAWLFLGGEAAVVILLIAGGPLLPLAFALAGLLLFLFTLALLSALRRGLETSCNCFGASEKPLTYYDVGRNAGFIACSLLGWWLMAQVPVTTQPSNWAELALLGFFAAVFVIVWTQLGELATLLANPR